MLTIDLPSKTKYSANRLRVERERQGQIGSQKLSLYSTRSYQILNGNAAVKVICGPNLFPCNKTGINKDECVAI